MYTQQIIQIPVIKSRVDAIMLMNIFGFHKLHQEAQQSDLSKHLTTVGRRNSFLTEINLLILLIFTELKNHGFRYIKIVFIAEIVFLIVKNIRNFWKKEKSLQALPWKH